MHVVSKPVFKLRFLVLPALLATALVLTIGRDGSSRLESLDGYTMGTRYHLQLAGVPEGLSRESLVTEIDDLLRYLDREVFSTYVQESELSRFNRHPVGSAFAASPELLEVMSLALEIAANTDGAFDPTIGALVDLWGFGPGRNQGKGIVPSTTEIQSLPAY
ncbi:MAG: FAD:protein FMN transferase [Gammaproteobacteria bacterium]|nr:FAD:protein FMN transferase [Gammaproteobacteria bacterium]